MTQLPENAISALRLMPNKASEIAKFSYQIVKAVQEGNANPLEVLVMLRSLEAVSELVRDELEEYFVREADKHAEKKFEAFGAVLEKAEVSTKYNYAKSGDIEWEQLNSEFESLKARKADREAFLRMMKSPLTMVNKDTGEVYEVKPPIKTSKSGIKTYLK